MTINGVNRCGAVLRSLGVYGGASGVWIDKERTSSIVPSGVAVGLLHTGQRYAQDLSEDGVIYHYPQTDHAPSRDLAEIDAIKAAKELQLPLFVITRTDGVTENRDVFLSVVEDCDEERKAFLVTFSRGSVGSPEEQIEEAASPSSALC